MCLFEEGSLHNITNEGRLIILQSKSIENISTTLCGGKHVAVDIQFFLFVLKKIEIHLCRDGTERNQLKNISSSL